ncbi:immunoglobulin-like domain-containing protein [Microbacterium sp. 4R-513]|uniref:immunoglobulin-like domain-containing protein n=1 Tax=Microbacterium sp. 4R-513 TaxID=2567934 RepID=UPI001F496273|nr:immunoglobulin-like domain-containing protein [Microbacterium sp. 4R-513]
MKKVSAVRRGFGRRALASSLAGVLAVTAFGLAAPTAAQAADVPAPSAHYDMSHSGTSLLDVSGNGRNATLTSLTDSSFVKVGSNDDVLRFKADGYAALPKGLVTGTDNNFTVEYTVTTQTATNQFGWVIGDGVGAWNTTALGNHVFVNPRSGESAYSNAVLSGIRVKTATANGETRMPNGGGLNPGFTTLTLVGSGQTLTLYRDGVQISTVTHTNSLSSIIPAGSTLGYLGRSLYTGDALLRADVTDVKFWDVSLTADQVSSSMPTAADKKASTDGVIRLDITPTVLGANPSLDQVTSKLTLPASSNGIALTWASSNPAVVSTTGVVSRSISADTPVTLTATTSLGTTITLDVIVKAPNVSADLDAIVLAQRTTENLPLAVKGSANGAAITWTSSDPALVTGTDASYAAPAVGAADPYAGGGIVKRPAYGDGDKQVTLTARATLNGQTQERTFQVTVAEKGRWAPDAGYAAAYFKSDSDEKIYQAATSGNDFFTFSPVNGGNAVITSTADTKGLRDPYILRSKDGDKYYMVATDLCISCGTGWGPAQSNGSLKIEVWESTDLVSWTRTNGANTGITINQPEAGMTWAPEAYWDDALQSYVVFFSSRMYADAAHTNSDKLYARVYYVLTRDFRTFTYPPTSWQDTGYARIDSTVTKIGDYYYRFSKNEESGTAGILEAGKDIFLEKSKVLTAPTTQSNWSADPNTTWQLTDTRMTSLETGQAGEGPEIVKLNAGDPNNNAAGDGYVFLVDNYGAGGYRAFVTSGSAIASSSQADRLSQRAEWNVRPVGGLPASPRHGSFVSVNQSVLNAVNSWSAVKAVASTTTLTADGRDVTAVVKAADGGEVAGTVTFTGGAWSKTVKLSAGKATTEVPAGVGSVTAKYDGYTDARVSVSTSSAVSLAVDIVTTAATRCVAGKITEVLTVRNADGVSADVRVTGAYGSKTVTVAAGKSVSVSFTTRLASIGADAVTVTATATDGRSHSSTVTVPAAGCN